MAGENLRKVRYSVRTDTSEQVEGDLRHTWTVAIVNEPREVRRIRDRLYAQLSPCADEFQRYDSIVPGSRGLHCNIFTFNSASAKFIDTTKIYNADIRRDRTLSELPDSGLDNYVARLTSISEARVEP
jgi:hypothetical protein